MGRNPAAFSVALLLISIVAIIFLSNRLQTVEKRATAIEGRVRALCSVLEADLRAIDEQTETRDVEARMRWRHYQNPLAILCLSDTDGALGAAEQRAYEAADLCFFKSKDAACWRDYARARLQQLAPGQ